MPSKGHSAMRAVVSLAAIFLVATALSGCAAVSVASTAVDVATTAVSTTAHVAGSAVSTATDAVTGGDKDDDDRSGDDR
jgi:hypothetical protein